MYLLGLSLAESTVESFSFLYVLGGVLGIGGRDDATYVRAARLLPTAATRNLPPTTKTTTKPSNRTLSSYSITMNRFVSLCLIVVALVASSVQGFAPSSLGGISGGELSTASCAPPSM